MSLSCVCVCCSYLGTVDLIGTAYEDNFVATGIGNHFAIPLLRNKWAPDMTEAQARTLLEDCMRVCYYRDCRTVNRVTKQRLPVW